MKKRWIVEEEQGSTLNEALVVLSIIGILASMAVASYTILSDKAKSVEAETALVEISRLETMYYDTHGQYSSDVHALGYAGMLSLKYYVLEVSS